MNRTLADSRRWLDLGTGILLLAVDRCAREYDDPTALPGWSRRHVIAHVAANADALHNLVRWAATGVPTPMYTSPAARAAQIEAALTMPDPDLESWLRESASGLTSAIDDLNDAQWMSQVVTAQGRTADATEIPWLRAREVWVHAIDLDSGLRFGDLPTDFLEALVGDVLARRGRVPDVLGPLAERTAWLVGRRHKLASAPDIGPWL